MNFSFFALKKFAKGFARNTESIGAASKAEWAGVILSPKPVYDLQILSYFKKNERKLISALTPQQHKYSKKEKVIKYKSDNNLLS